MKEKELLDIWKSNDQKLDKVLALNKELVYNMTEDKIKNTIGMMKRPKQLILLLGLPYIVFLYTITFIAFKAGGLLVAIGFGSISLIMTAIIIAYFYHIHLINQISRFQEVVIAQKKIAELKLSSFNITRLAILQLPFWSICWVSLDALKESPIWYGGINLLVFAGLVYASYWLYKSLSIENNSSKVSQFFLAGIEWEPILKATEILEQLEEYRDQ